VVHGDSVAKLLNKIVEDLPQVVIEEVYDRLDVLDRTRYNIALSSAMRVDRTQMTDVVRDKAIGELFRTVQTLHDTNVHVVPMSSVEKLVRCLKDEDPTRVELQKLFPDVTFEPYYKDRDILPSAANIDKISEVDHEAYRIHKFDRISKLIREEGRYDACTFAGEHATSDEFDELMDSMTDWRNNTRSFGNIVFGMVNKGNFSLLRHVTEDARYADVASDELLRIISVESPFMHHFKIVRNFVQVPQEYAVNGLARSFSTFMDESNVIDFFTLRKKYSDLKEWRMHVRELQQ